MTDKLSKAPQLSEEFSAMLDRFPLPKLSENLDDGEFIACHSLKNALADCQEGTQLKRQVKLRFEKFDSPGRREFFYAALCHYGLLLIANKETDLDRQHIAELLIHFATENFPREPETKALKQFLNPFLGVQNGAKAQIKIMDEKPSNVSDATIAGIMSSDEWAEMVGEKTMPEYPDYSEVIEPEFIEQVRLKLDRLHLKMEQLPTLAEIAEEVEEKPLADAIKKRTHAVEREIERVQLGIYTFTKKLITIAQNLKVDKKGNVDLQPALKILGNTQTPSKSQKQLMRFFLAHALRIISEKMKKTHERLDIYALNKGRENLIETFKVVADELQEDIEVSEEIFHQALQKNVKDDLSL